MASASDTKCSACEAVRQNPLFGDLLSPDERALLVQYGKVRAEEAGAVLCRQHQHDNRAFIILDGSVEISEEAQGRSIHIRTVHTGELLGEIGALFMMPRIATVTVSRPSVFLEIPGEPFARIIEAIPALRDTVFTRFRQRALETALRAVPGFLPLPDGALSALGCQAALVTYRAGEVIIREGELGDGLYVILSGEVRVYATKHGQSVDLATAGLGDVLGEHALLTGAPRAASAIALTQVEAAYIEREAFLRFIQDYPDVWDSLDFVSHQRARQTDPLNR